MAKFIDIAPYIIDGYLYNDEHKAKYIYINIDWIFYMRVTDIEISIQFYKEEATYILGYKTEGRPDLDRKDDIQTIEMLYCRNCKELRKLLGV